ncbi:MULTISPECIES: hypothetical protein [Winogradskyella]|uniref:Prophage protein DUF1660 n=1 Tax=Winogradskyella rapida TaxID=549701 RepID=A0ABW3KWP3_9FLAO|nr:hypothetical protein [Winogradskyella arenosi]
MKNIYCSLFGHRYQVSKKVTYHVKEYKCKHCKTEMTINGDGALTPLTPKFKEINKILHRIHKKRLKKRQQLFTLDHQ